MESLLAQGLELMLLGMAVVFSFLIVLVCCTSLMSLLINRYFPEPLASAVPSSSSAVQAASSAAPDALTRRLIEDAIRQHRRRIGRG